MGNNKTTLGIEENVEGLLCYVLGFLTGIVFWVLEKENKLVRFHAMQSIVVFLALFIISIVAGVIPIIGTLISIIIFPVSIILWILLMVKAYQGEKYKLPWVGNFAEQQVFYKND